MRNSVEISPVKVDTIFADAIWNALNDYPAFRRMMPLVNPYENGWLPAFTINNYLRAASAMNVDLTHLGSVTMAELVPADARPLSVVRAIALMNKTYAALHQNGKPLHFVVGYVLGDSMLRVQVCSLYPHQFVEGLLCGGLRNACHIDGPVLTETLAFDDCEEDDYTVYTIVLDWR